MYHTLSNKNILSDYNQSWWQPCYFRGDEADYGYIPKPDKGSSASTTAVDAIAFTRNPVTTPSLVDRDPTWEDMLIAYATVPGYVANR